MKKSLKALFMASMLPVMILMAAVTLTSCEGTLDDIFGEWSRPTNQQNNEPTKEELLSDLSSALEEGAIVTITYTIDGVEYTSTFKKVGDEYVEQSTTSAARALTRGELGPIEKRMTLVTYVNAGSDMPPILDFEVCQGTEVKLDVQIDVATAEYTTIFADPNAAIKKFHVDNKKVPINTPYDQKVNVLMKTESGTNIVLGTVSYKQGETWQQVYERLTKSGKMMLQVDNSLVQYTNVYSGTLYYDIGNLVPSSDEVGKDGVKTYLLQGTEVEYKEASWNSTSHEVNYNDVNLGFKYTGVTSSSTDVKWQTGMYVVFADVTIKGNLKIEGKVKLILCNNAKLTVNGSIHGNGKSLTIYGQSQDADGKLEVKSSVEGLANFSHLTIHGGNITVNCLWNGIYGNGIYGNSLTVYGGKLSVTSEGNAIETYRQAMTVYGGHVIAISNGLAGINLGEGTLTVYRGRVTAEGGEGNPAIEGKFKAGQESTIKYKVGVDQVEGIIMWGDDSEMQTTPRQLSNEYRYFKAWPSSN